MKQNIVAVFTAVLIAFVPVWTNAVVLSINSQERTGAGPPPIQAPPGTLAADLEKQVRALVIKELSTMAKDVCTYMRIARLYQIEIFEHLDGYTIELECGTPITRREP